jgi:hypothetical protein
VDDGADGTAIHDNIAGEILAVALKAVPASADVLLIEDIAGGNAKKRITVGSLPTGGGGEANTGSSVNVGGVGVFKQKTGIDLEFRGINAASAKATVVLDAGNNEIDIDVADATLTQAGAIELATQVEVDDGLDATRAIVPSTLAGSTLAGDVTANNAKVTNATHTGEVTGSGALTITADAVTNAKLANVATATIKGRVTAATGDPEDLNGTQVTTLLAPFTSALQGVVPASGGVSTDFLSADGTWSVPAGGGGGVIDTGNTLWVDAVFGNDGTGTSDRQDLPFLTIAAALTAAVSGDTVRVRAGVYVESGLTIPTGVACIGAGLLNTIVGDVAATADIFALSSGSLLQDMRITLPGSAPHAGVKHIAGTGTVYNLDLRGDGGTGNGTGIYKTGAGASKIVGGNIRCEGGGMAALIRVDAGVLALDAVHVPQSAGTIDDVVLVQGTGKFQGQGVNIGSSNAVDCLHVEGTGTAIIYSPNWANAQFGGHIAADGVTVVISGGKIDATAATLLIDSGIGLTGLGTVLTVTGTDIEPLFSFPSAVLEDMDLSAQFHQNETSTRNAESRVLGSTLVTGFPEVGSALMIGEGGAYSDGIKVVTSDGTATSTTLGGNLTDVTVAAQSRSGSSVTYQGLAANHCIYVASTRILPAGGNMKHWGVFIDQTTRGIGGSYVTEIWNGSAWVEIGIMASSQDEVYRYSDALFIRPLAPATNSKEFIQYGIDTTTTQAAIAVDGVTAYWTRFRVVTLMSTAPIFQRIWMVPSHAMFSEIGRRRALGLALWRKTLVSAGNVFGETGTVVAANFPVGSGASPASWTHNSPNSLLNSSGDAVYAQFALPEGICTAFPLTIRVVFALNPGGTLTDPIVGFISAIPIQTAFNEVADPAGGLVPVPRTIADTEATTAKAATTVTFTSSDFGTVWPANTFFKGSFGPFPIHVGCYADDVMLIRLELNDDGLPNQDVAIIAMIVEGVEFADGGAL